MTKRALIVDDSKTARLVLSNKLLQYGIDVDTRESAAAAIDYLYDNAPDAIFMDYEMPGMDGFQALKVIKSNPHTAVIPVMMYTSKAGGLAMSQARALGAVGVLPKKLEPQDLEGVLHSLHLMPEQDSLARGLPDDELRSLRRVPHSENVHPIGEAGRRGAMPVEPVTLPMGDLQGAVPVDENLKKFMRREQGQVEERLKDQLEKQYADFHGDFFELEAHLEENNQQVRRVAILSVSTLILLAAGFLFALFQYNPMMQTNKAAVSESELSEVMLERLIAQDEKIDLITTAVYEGVADSSGERSQNLPLGLIEWAANQGTHFNYGEMPFNDTRALWLSELVEQLKTAGFQGSIELRASYGNFCLTKDAAGSLQLADPGLELSQCQFKADLEERDQWRNEQSVAFANYLNVEIARSGGEVEILLFNSGLNNPQYPYPERYEAKTAGEWNRVAGQNQRIQVNLYNGQ
ncbi:MAG: response regulator [Candidatus Thiodiazotropha sp. (ex Semelilucina semeliformis)]|nr:response regulator [Candidatus Thiodiazotropha sp. (ex Semelilucina semeliformis)]